MFSRGVSTIGLSLLRIATLSVGLVLPAPPCFANPGTRMNLARAAGARGDHATQVRELRALRQDVRATGTFGAKDLAILDLDLATSLMLRAGPHGMTSEVVTEALSLFSKAAAATQNGSRQVTPLRAQALSGKAAVYFKIGKKPEAIQALRDAARATRNGLGKDSDLNFQAATSLAQSSPDARDQRPLVDALFARLPPTSQQLYLPLRKLSWKFHEEENREQATHYALLLKRLADEKKKSPAWTDAVIHLATIQMAYKEGSVPDLADCTKHEADLARAEELLRMAGFPHTGPPLTKEIHAWGAWSARFLQEWCRGEASLNDPRRRPWQKRTKN